MQTRCPFTEQVWLCPEEVLQTPVEPQLVIVGQHSLDRVFGLFTCQTGASLAVLHRHGGISTYDQDVFVNVVGGIRISETGADLPVLMAILSSLRNRPLPDKLVTFGEVGLAGEIRPVQNGPERLHEAVKHGFTQAIVPRANCPKSGIDGLEIIPVTQLGQVLERI